MVRMIVMAAISGVALMLISASTFAESRQGGFELVPHPERLDRAGWVLQKVRANTLDCGGAPTLALQHAILGADQTYFDHRSMFVFVANDIWEPGQKRIVTDVVLTEDHTEIKSIVSSAQELTVAYSGPADQPVVSPPTYVTVKELIACRNGAVD